MSMPMMPDPAMQPPAAPPADPNMAPVIPIEQAPSYGGPASASPRRDENLRKQREAATKARESYAASHRYTSTPRVDLQLSGQVRQLFNVARDAKRPLVSRWNTNYLYLRNRPNQVSLGQSRSIPLIPEIFPIIASKVGWKIDRRFRTTVTSAAVLNTDYYADTSSLANDLAAVLDATYQINLEGQEITRAIWDGENYGTGILKTSWNPGLSGGLGDAMTTRVDPYTFYPDPHARSLDDANYLCEVRTMSIQEADRRWPGSARVLSESFYNEDAPEAMTQVESWSTFPRANPGAMTPGHTPQYGMVGGGFLHTTDTPGVTIIECWMRCHDAVKDDQAPLGYRIEDYWRVVVICGNHVLMDEPATNLWSHGLHPYSRYVPQDIGEFWGFSTVEMLIPTQRTVNRLLSAFVMNLELSGNPVMVDDLRAGISRTQATNRPGSRYTVASGSRVDWMKPPPVNAQFMEVIRYCLQRMEAVSGLAAVTRGGTTPGRNAQGVMDAMQEAAFVRIRMELRQLEYTLTDAGKKKASLITENYTEARTLAIIGPDGAKKMLDVKPRHFMCPTESGEVPLEYTLLIDAGASEHTSRKVREDLALSLANMGMLDARAVLEAVDWPGRDSVAKRVEAQQQMMAASGQAPK